MSSSRMQPVQTASTTTFVQSRSVGAIIGKRGATIKELEAMTSCRVRLITEREEEERSSTTQVCIASNTMEAREAREARCLRIIQLMDEEGLSLDKAEAQVKSELEAQSGLEAEQWRKEQTVVAVRRITINCPEFAEEDVAAALKEACDDEDAAIDLLYSGYRSPRREDVESAAHIHPEARLHKVPEESFPALVSTNASPTCCAKWAKGLATSRCVKRSNLQCHSEFPGLPRPTLAHAATANRWTRRIR